MQAHLKASNDGFEITVKYLFFTIYPRKPKEKKPEKIKEKKKDKASDKKEEDIQLEKDIPPAAEERSPSEKPQEPPMQEVKEDVKVQEEPEEKDLPKAKKRKPTRQEKKELKKLRKEAEALAPEEKKEGKLASLKKKWLKIKPYVPTAWKTVKKLLKTIRFCDTDIQLLVAKEDPYESAVNYGKMSAIVNNALAVLSMIFTVKLKRCAVNCGFNENLMKYGVDVTVRVRPSAVIAIAFCTLVNFAGIFISGKIKSWRLKKANKIKNSDETEMLVNE